VLKRIFITGVDGFIGSWLARTLLERGAEVFGLARRSEGDKDGIIRFRGEITNRAEVEAAIRESRPDAIFHLAAQNNVMQSIRDPVETVSVNIQGSIHVFEAVRTCAPTARVISVGSSSEYGKTASVHSFLEEDLPLLPSNGYGAAKASQGMFASVFARVFGLDIIHVRPFAVIGPGKTGDALADFCQGVVAIERGAKEAFSVGNLTAVRDFVDVRDCISAFLLLLEQGKGGEVYNICNAHEGSLEDVLGILRELASRSIRTEVDPERMRPADDLRIVGSNRKLRKCGYAPGYALPVTVRDTLAWWRSESFPGPGLEAKERDR
jgi:GDP-4-dehydro-6-deoxy-D-mannose reductase